MTRQARRPETTLTRECRWRDDVLQPLMTPSLYAHARRSNVHVWLTYLTTDEDDRDDDEEEEDLTKRDDVVTLALLSTLFRRVVPSRPRLGGLLRAQIGSIDQQALEDVLSRLLSPVDAVEPSRSASRYNNKGTPTIGSKRKPQLIIVDLFYIYFISFNSVPLIEF